MNLFLCADSYGEIEALNRRINDLAEKVGPPDWVLHVGSFGVWPDPNRVDKATASGKNVDFIRFYADSLQLSFPIAFLPGRHEDHKWLKAMYNRGYTEIVPKLYRLLPGYHMDLRARDESVRVLGLPGVYSPKTYHNYRSEKKHPLFHYTREGVERACTQGPVDIFLSAEAGKGTRLGVFESQAEGINNALFATRPKLHVHAHYGISAQYLNPKTNTPTISLPKRGILPIRYNPNEGQFIVLGEEGETVQTTALGSPDN